MRSWSIPAGRLFGVDVRLHLTCFLLPIFLYWTEYSANNHNASGARNLALTGLILVCVAAHECGHILASRRFGLVPKAVILLPLTGVTLYDEPRAEKLPAGAWWKREIRLALVGPLVNLALACFAAVVISAVAPGIELGKLPLVLARNLPRSPVGANLYLAILNLMPLIPWMADAFCARFSPARSISPRPPGAPCRSATPSRWC